MSEDEKPERNVFLLGLTSFLNDASSELIAPVLPAFIASLGGSSIAIGLIGGLRDSISSMLKVFSGYASDKIKKRKIFVFLGYSISSFFKLLLSLSQNIFQAIAYASFERTGKGLREAPRDAIIAESAKKARHGKSFGLHRAMDTMGAILGSILAFVFIYFFDFEVREIILIAALIGFASLLPIKFVKEIREEDEGKNGKENEDAKNSAEKPGAGFFESLEMLPRELKLYIIIAGIFSLGNISYMFFILKAQESFSIGIALPAAVFLYIIFNVFYAFFAIPFGMLADKAGRKEVLFIGYLLFSLTALSFAFFNSFLSLLLLFSFYGISYAIIDANQRAFVSDLSAGEEKALGFGAFHSMISFSALLGNIIAGFLYKALPGFAFIYASLLAFTSALLLLKLT